MWDITQLQAIHLLDLSISGGVCKVVERSSRWKIGKSFGKLIHTYTSLPESNATRDQASVVTRRASSYPED